MATRVEEQAIRSRSQLCVVVLAGTTLGVVFCAQRIGAQPVLLQSGTLGATGQYGGNSATSAQFVGWRFQIDSPLDVDRVGGHLLGSFEGLDIFAAIVSLQSIDSFPAGAPFTPAEVLATTTFVPPLPSNEITVPLSVPLKSGSYALVFGSGLFGATGTGGIVNSSDQMDIPPTDISSFIFWGIPGPNQPPEWRTNLASHMHLVIDAHVPIPGDYDHDGDVDADDYNVWDTDFGSTAILNADGNSDNVVDAADYTIWRDNLGRTTGGTELTAVSEPTSGLIMLMAVVTFVGMIQFTTSWRSFNQ